MQWNQLPFRHHNRWTLPLRATAYRLSSPHYCTASQPRALTRNQGATAVVHVLIRFRPSHSFRRIDISISCLTTTRIQKVSLQRFRSSNLPPLSSSVLSLFPHIPFTHMSTVISIADINLLVERNDQYPQQIWYGFAVFLFVVGAFQWGSFLHSKFARRAPHQPDERMAISNDHHKFSLRRIPLALVNFYRVIAFRCTLEIGSYNLNMAEIFVTLGYIALLLTYTLINTTSVEGQRFSAVYWNGRVGNIVVSQLPIVTALGTKNNLVSLVTGISYDRLNYIHRMMARTCFALLWVHVAGQILGNPDFESDSGQGWLHMGLVGMVALSILIVVSLRPIRTASYEIFFFTHFIAVIIFLAAAYRHTLGAGSGSSWVWPSFVIWGLDRFIRLIRLVVFNHSYFGFKSGSGTMYATTELLSDDVVRLHLRRPPHFKWHPGQTAYLIMPSVSTLPFEAHPFTIASIDSSRLTSENQSNDDYEASGPSAPYWKELVFLINVHKGFTKKLREVAVRKGQVKVFVDGPYGPSHDLGSYDTSVLVAGGSGVSYTLPVLLDIIESVRTGRSSCKRVVFIWSVRQAAHVQWIEEALAKAIQIAPPSLTVSVRIFVTGRSPLSQSKMSRDDDPISSRMIMKDIPLQPMSTRPTSATTSIVSLPSVRGANVENGRPNIDAMLKEEVSGASGRMSVSVCGSQGLARSVRHALRFPVSGPADILSGGASVTLFVESFGYA